MGFLEEGKAVEREFSKLFSNVTFSTKEQDIIEHWDLEIDYNGERKKIDVKGLKKQSREDRFYDENFHWLELSNVHGGKRTGWLYSGVVDMFAFETIDYWIICNKKVLQDFIEAKCKGKKIEKTKNPYTFFRRESRKDIIVKVKTIDLFYIADKVLLKSNP